MRRLNDLEVFYSLLDELARRARGPRRLAECNGRLGWPKRGVYFFFEPGEPRSHSGDGLRVVRVGTHALTAGSGSSLWGRLSQHRGQAKGGGNHRGSIFRLLVGKSLMRRDGYLQYSTWGQGSSAPAAIRHGEVGLEVEVSRVIGCMPFLWLTIEDAPGPESERGLVERNAIALLSNYGKEALDPPSAGWLGHSCDRERVRGSGLWNSNHVEESYDPAFLDVMARLVAAEGGQS
ncbi:MAG: hypothetical protein JNM90_25850 [Burkholderiales bacterium]|nr:hypothetical protein [Burkholderiales bacterium]